MHVTFKCKEWLDKKKFILGKPEQVTIIIIKTLSYWGLDWSAGNKGETLFQYRFNLKPK